MSARKERFPSQIDHLIGQKVYVYRNLHTGGFSVMVKGKVVAHVKAIALQDVEFRVRPGGRERAVAEGVRNVHAFAIGTVQRLPKKGFSGFRLGYTPVSPHFDTDFVLPRSPGRPAITGADEAFFYEAGAWCLTPKYKEKTAA